MDDSIQVCEAKDPYDPAYIFRSIFGSKMKGHWQRWPFIDLEELKSVNPDCVGWIHMDGSPIDYPVVKQRFDRDYNLTHNFSGEKSVHGQVSMDFMHGGRMGDRITVLRAHHMRDWSMFKSVVSLVESDFLAAHPTVELIHEGTHYAARWFAGVLYHQRDAWPERTHFANEADFEAWLARVMSKNVVAASVQPPAGAHLLACCTCAYSIESYDAFAAFAAIEEQN